MAKIEVTGSIAGPERYYPTADEITDCVIALKDLYIRTPETDKQKIVRAVQFLNCYRFITADAERVKALGMKLARGTAKEGN